MDTFSRWKISHMVVSKRVLCKKVATCFDSKWEAGWMMEGPSVNPSASIAVHYIHWPWRRDPLSSDAREGWDASSREKLLATSGEEGTQLQSYCNQLKLPGENLFPHSMLGLATLLKANQIKVVKVEKSPRPTAGLRTISTSGHGHAQAFDPRTLALNARSMHTWSQCKSEWGSNRSRGGLVLVLLESC